MSTWSSQAAASVAWTARRPQAAGIVSSTCNLGARRAGRLRSSCARRACRTRRCWRRARVPQCGGGLPSSAQRRGAPGKPRRSSARGGAPREIARGTGEAHLELRKRGDAGASATARSAAKWAFTAVASQRAHIFFDAQRDAPPCNSTVAVACTWRWCSSRTWRTKRKYNSHEMYSSRPAVASSTWRSHWLRAWMLASSAAASTMCTDCRRRMREWLADVRGHYSISLSDASSAIGARWIAALIVARRRPTARPAARAAVTTAPTRRRCVDGGGAV